MSISTCWSCHSLLRLRLRAQISLLQQARRPASTNARPSLSWYNDTTAPTPTQLKAAENFFLKHQPRKLWTATEWRKHTGAEETSLGLIPEVVFLGRSNVGKSSLLNALLISPALNHVGPRPGKTTTMHAWAISPTDPKTGGAVKGSKGDMITKCAVLDMPGYGYGSHDDWGEEIMSYLKNRKQLKRAFVLVDGRHGLKSGDVTMLKLLRKQGVSAQVVVSKCDKMGAAEGKQLLGELWDDIQDQVNGPGLGLLGEVLVVGSLGDGRKNDKVHYDNMSGVHEVQWAVLRATGLDSYAVTIASQGNKISATSTSLIDNAAILSANIPNNPPTPTRAPNPVQDQPLPDLPFSWPAKIRQHPSSTLESTPTQPSPSPSLKARRPMNPPALAPGFQSGLGDLPFDVKALFPSQQRHSDPTSRGETRKEPSRPHLERPRQTLVASGMSSVKGRRIMEYGAHDTPRSIENSTFPTRTSKPSAWTGSAVGGMADLEALSSRSAGGRKPHANPTSKAPARRKGKQPKAGAHTEVSSREMLPKHRTEKPKEAWTGSAVGGMADLEAMMARALKPSGGGGGGGGGRGGGGGGGGASKSAKRRRNH